MGLMHSGVPRELGLVLKEAFHLDTFVETGTYHGDSAAWAASLFAEVFTVEFSKPVYEIAVAKYGKVPNIKFNFGDSRQVLQNIVPLIKGPSLFWLDGHWSGESTYGENDECPLLDELAVINQSEYPHFILIDDAYLFVSPPHTMHDLAQWPNISQVIHALETNKHPCYIVVFEDAIIAVPEYAKLVLAAYCQARVTEQVRWDDSPTRKGLHLIGEGFRSLVKGIRLRMKSFGINVWNSNLSL